MKSQKIGGVKICQNCLWFTTPPYKKGSVLYLKTGILLAFWPLLALDRSQRLINCLTPQHEKSDDIEKKEPFKEVFDVLYKNHGRWGSFRSERTNNDDVNRFHVSCENTCGILICDYDFQNSISLRHYLPVPLPFQEWNLFTHRT